ncbi:NAD(P)-binding domain-containing protein [Actinomadura sp. DC4]|uniref:NADPH-dependent F420 reductase n=1 Tax=Actinomadura sp. DC4 TaxID=3055069 RepID=UPI0025B04AF0|nr:NAD(P)-binding domain-containing protein [Actinomadura sp. DC4]MDN3358379.1 NAD(P)-binding domain-containing protein [Actinomadura sp. DC4]
MPIGIPTVSPEPTGRRSTMRIGILGAGNMAEALGTQWARAGHEVVIGARTTAKATALADRIGPPARAAAGLRAAAENADAVLLAVLYEAVPEVLDAAGDALRDRPLLDCVNGIVHPGVTLAAGGGPSVAEQIAARSGARVVKAFNLCHESVWRRTPPHFDGRPLTVPLCGDDPDALATARALVTGLGCEPVEAGGLDRAGLLEATAAFAIGLYLAGADPQAVFPPVAYAVG